MALLTTIIRGGRWRGWRAGWLLGLASLCAALPAARAQTPTSVEYQVKAALLYKLAQFVEWPARAFPDANSPLVIGVLGEDPFGAYLDDLVKGEKIGARPLVVRRFARVEDVTECHMLFVSASEVGALDKIFAQLKGRSILTIGDTDTFTQQGGMIRFFTEKDKIHFKINVVAAKAGELVPSSKILSPATIATPGTD